jgi:hypothetical protein
MSYIPVGTILTYTCKYNATTGHLGSVVFTNWSQIVAQLSIDLKNLPGLEELDVQTSDGSNNYISGDSTFTMTVLDNGVDHGDENDIKGIIDGTIEGYGVTIISSSIPKFQLPNNPEDDQSGKTIDTGAGSNQPPPSPPLKLPSLSLSGGSIAGISITVIIIGIVALILLLPSGFGRALGAVRR